MSTPSFSGTPPTREELQKLIGEKVGTFEHPMADFEYEQASIALESALDALYAAAPPALRPRNAPEIETGIDLLRMASFDAGHAWAAGNDVDAAQRRMYNAEVALLTLLDAPVVAGVVSRPGDPEWFVPADGAVSDEEVLRFARMLNQFDKPPQFRAALEDFAGRRATSAGQRVCDCDEWEPGVEKINGPLLLAQARNPHLTNTPEFQFNPFRYCPWCAGTVRPSAPRVSQEAPL